MPDWLSDDMLLMDSARSSVCSDPEVSMDTGKSAGGKGGCKPSLLVSMSTTTSSGWVTVVVSMTTEVPPPQAWWWTGLHVITSCRPETDLKEKSELLGFGSIKGVQWQSTTSFLKVGRIISKKFWSKNVSPHFSVHEDIRGHVEANDHSWKIVQECLGASEDRVTWFDLQPC